MKKSNILIAAFVILSAASEAKSENVTVDFERGTSGPVNFAEAIRKNVAVPGDPTLPSAVTVAELAETDFFNQHGGIQPIYQPIPLGNTWYELVRCDGNLTDWEAMIADSQEPTPQKAARMFHPSLQRKLREVLLGYCNTYPEFAEVVLPMLVDKNAKVAAHKGFVYIISGNSIIRFGGITSQESASLSRKGGSTSGLGLIGAIVEAAGAVNDAIEAWNEYGSWPPVPDNGTADDYHGPALTVKPEDGVPVVYDNYGQK